MSIRIESAASGDALTYRFSGRISEDDMLKLRYAEDRYFASLPAGQCLNIIADFSEIDSIAPQLFPQLQRMRMVTEPRIGLVIVAGANSYLRALTISLGLVAGSVHNIIFSDSPESARSLLPAAVS